MAEIIGYPHGRHAAVLHDFGVVILQIRVVGGRPREEIEVFVYQRDVLQQSDGDCPAHLKRITVRRVIRHMIQPPRQLDRLVLVSTPEQRVDAHPKHIRQLWQQLDIGRSAVLPFRNRLRRNSQKTSELLLCISLFIAVFSDLLPDGPHSQPSVDLLILLYQIHMGLSIGNIHLLRFSRDKPLIFQWIQKVAAVETAAPVMSGTTSGVITLLSYFYLFLCWHPPCVS